MLCLRARAKINWTLDILGTRQDGYHLMDMLMQSVALHDTLFIAPADKLTLEAADEAVSHVEMLDQMSAKGVLYDESNLVYRAADKLRRLSGIEMGARMRLRKRIPSGAGMGGGSADAAAALVGLNELWGLGLSTSDLLSIGLSLGADIPFMLTGGLARVGGIGERITPLSPAPLIWLVLVQPCDGLSTKEVFSKYDALDPLHIAHPNTEGAQTALLNGDFHALQSAMGNVLEAVSRPSRPAIAECADALMEAGAACAMMTGSGSVVYGAFGSREEAERAHAALCARYGVCLITHTETSGIIMEGDC